MLFARFLENNFADFAGGRIHVELPVNRALVNWYVEGMDLKALHKLEITGIQDGQISLNLETSIPFFKDRNIVIALHDADPDLKFQIELIDGINFLERTVIAGFLPEGMQLDKREITVDTRVFLSKSPVGQELLDKISNLAFRSDRDRLMVLVDLML